jgi:hypothetical protein
MTTCKGYESKFTEVVPTTYPKFPFKLPIRSSLLSLFRKLSPTQFASVGSPLAVPGVAKITKVAVLHR